MNRQLCSTFNRSEKMDEIYKTFMAEAERLDPEGFAKARAERAELEALRKDAERYRKLRAGQYSYWTARSILNDSPHGIDRAVDALPAVGAA